MNDVSPRFVIADPSLADARGHHFSLTLQLSKGAQALGLKVVWLTHKDFKIEEDIENVTVIPVFSFTMYDRYKPELKNTLPDNKEQLLFEELKGAIKGVGLTQHDHIIFHTAFGDVYRALPLYLALDNIEDWPYLHICTPYEPEGMPGRDPGDEVDSILSKMNKSKIIDKKLFFWAETPQLASNYTTRFFFNVRALPLPPPAIDLTVDCTVGSGAFVALYLGAAREEKGFVHLPEIVEGLYESHGKTGKLQFVIQCTPQIIGYLSSIKIAIERLSKYPASYVTLIKESLSEADYHTQMAKSNVLMLLYSQKNYRIRGSGIAVEAVSSEKCILTFKDTFCESLITFNGGEAVDDVGQAIKKLAQMVDNKEAYLYRAKIQGKEYREVNCVSEYVKRVLSQPEVSIAYTPRFVPSRLIGKITKPLLRI